MGADARLSSCAACYSTSSAMHMREEEGAIEPEKAVGARGAKQQTQASKAWARPRLECEEENILRVSDRTA